jgi:hypothetical protein
VFIHRRLRSDGQPVGPVKLNLLPSDNVTYDDEIANYRTKQTISTDDEEEDEEEDEDEDEDDDNDLHYDYDDDIDTAIKKFDETVVDVDNDDEEDSDREDCDHDNHEDAPEIEDDVEDQAFDLPATKSSPCRSNIQESLESNATQRALSSPASILSNSALFLSPAKGLQSPSTAAKATPSPKQPHPIIISKATPSPQKLAGKESSNMVVSPKHANISNPPSMSPGLIY